jgi:LacI family transcriptional regulator
VVTDEISASREAINYLISLGHQQIAIVNPLMTHGAGLWRSEGYRQALAENGIKLEPAYLLEMDRSPELEKDIRRLLSLPNPPTAIFAVNDSFAATVYKVAYQLGIMIPHQLSVIGFDDAPLAQFLWPPLSSVRQPIIELAEQAVALLVKSLLQHQPYQVSTLHCSLIQRSSVAPVVNRFSPMHKG